MRKTVNDPVLGKLEFNLFWKGKTTTRCFGNVIELYIESDNSVPGPRHHRVFEFFKAHEPQIHAAIEAGIFTYYNNVRDQYRKHLGADLKDKHEVIKGVGSL